MRERENKYKSMFLVLLLHIFFIVYCMYAYFKVNANIVLCSIRKVTIDLASGFWNKFPIDSMFYQARTVGGHVFRIFGNRSYRSWYELSFPYRRVLGVSILSLSTNCLGFWSCSDNVIYIFFFSIYNHNVITVLSNCKKIQTSCGVIL